MSEQQYLDIDDTDYSGKSQLWEAVARQLGWTVREQTGGGETWYVAYNPQGQAATTGMSHYGAFTNYAWLWEVVPRYMHSFDAAWSLVPDMSTGVYFYLSNTGTPFRCRVMNALTGENVADVLSGTVEGVICKAWLMWQDSQAVRS